MDVQTGSFVLFEAESNFIGHLKLFPSLFDEKDFHESPSFETIYSSIVVPKGHLKKAKIQQLYQNYAWLIDLGVLTGIYS